LANGRRLARVAAGLAAVFTLAGCGLTHPQDLSFRVDERLHFQSPDDRSTVRAPLTITWRISDFRIAAQSSGPASRNTGYFAAFVDKTPIKPGHTMDDIAKDDSFCEQSPTCPDAQYLSERNIYTTTKTSLEIPFIANISGNKEKLQLHTITIVLMDTSGHRIGESAWQLDVRIRKLGV
jgi:hypothetical protein